MNHLVTIVAMALGYLALAGVSAWLAFDTSDAWTVWLASGLTLGLLVGRPRATWVATLVGAGLGAAAFAFVIGSDPTEAGGYALIEIVAAGLAAWLVSQLAGIPLRLDNVRALAALIFGGALVMSVTSGLAAAGWHVASGGTDALATYRVWMASNMVGALLIAPAAIAWLQFRPRRSGGLPMNQFVGGAIAFAAFVAGVVLVFGDDATQRHDDAVTYLPVLFMALVALLWGVRGATLAALTGALIAVAMTGRGTGPFAGVDGWLGDPVLEAQAYAVSIALTGLLIGVLVEAQREALRSAREWQARFGTAIASHGLLAYEWDPPSGRLAITGDARNLVGFAPEAIATLDHWLQLVPTPDREGIATRFASRASGEGGLDVLIYRVTGADGRPLNVSDEARAVRDHDGSLHRVVGIIRRLDVPAHVR